MGRALPTSQRAYDYAKERILEGILAGGELISEGTVAAALGISRTPVREAFLRLEAEGLLRLYPKRGAVVVPVSAKEVEAVLETRELIESFAAEKVSSLGAEALEQLVGRLREQLREQKQLREAGDGKAFVAADQVFHQLIVTAADNPILLDLYAGLRDRQQRMGLFAVFHDHDRLRATNHEHVELVDLLERGDVTAYRAALRGHLRGTRAAALGHQDSSIQPSTDVD
ncbi:GntR family transcriptional regulator [Streptomyces albidus (ex Kaewkla and Franco 2022)]|uniref:GntR family transcriptional regulator n=1 Tax=Streptomyces albidus (ex Kaewkla and Franco 2022) TaxID=722709 RepID=UPI0015EEB305|nr:GntR family transcriptional regulator [Streptomyces albidus (ex Kaewkla and Franco 2022)]